MSPKLSLKGVSNALVKEFAPEFVAGALGEQARDKSVGEFYHYIEQGIWDGLPQGQKQFLINQKPWDLSWLDLDFVIEAIGQSNKKIAYLIISSPELQTKIQENINSIKETLNERENKQEGRTG